MPKQQLSVKRITPLGLVMPLEKTKLRILVQKDKQLTSTFKGLNFGTNDQVLYFLSLLFTIVWLFHIFQWYRQRDFFFLISGFSLTLEGHRWKLEDRMNKLQLMYNYLAHGPSAKGLLVMIIYNKICLLHFLSW